MVVAFGNVTSNSTHPFTPEPNGRGTWSLLSSCVVTIALCAWVALHLNVPEHGTTDRQWLRKTKWLTIGLAAPEMVVYVAWRQRQEAKRVLRDVRKLLGQPTPRSKLRRIWHRCLGFRRARSNITSGSSPAATTFPKPEWTLVHGFYAVMGGFALDSSNATENFLPDSRTRAALTTTGLGFLLEHEPDLLPDVSEDQIKDKSKADGLQKFLICVQALWFCATCITRLASSLPISLLELNAFGHALCALLIYAMWWQKPLDVDEPSLIEENKAQPLLAYMWMSSGIGAKDYKSYDMHMRLRDEFDALWPYQLPQFHELLFGGEETPASHAPQGMNQVEDTRSIRDQYPLFSRNYNSSSTPSIRYRLVTYLHSKPYLSTLGIRFPAGLGTRKTAIDHISPPTLLRWKLAHEAIKKHNLEDDIVSRYYRSDLYDQDSRVKARIGNLLPLLGSRAYEVWLGFAVAGVLYGGLHMLAWDAPFSSRLEQILWRVAASSVTVGPLLLAPVAFVFEQKFLGHGAAELVRTLRGLELTGIRGTGGRKASGVALWVTSAVAVLLIPLCALAPLLWFSYALGRVYLVVECFKNVAHLPEGVFEDVNWSPYLPHIT